MKIKGQHGEFGYTGPPDNPQPASKRQVELEKNERIRIRVLRGGKEEDIISYFTPGVLTLEWERGAKIEQ